MKILITGGAGFIGAALAHRLLQRGDSITAIDNLNDYYEVSLKQARLHRLTVQANFRFVKMDIADRQDVGSLFDADRFDVVVNLAAQAGVRYSLENPSQYVDANLVGFANILEGCRHGGVKHLVFASSSSVYGGNAKQPFAESDGVDHPISLYAATKKANELMAHTYAHLYSLPVTGLRFFTVYGPWGRPDMAFFRFTRLMLNGEKIPLYNHGNLSRDFTYIDDIVEGMVRVINRPASADAKFDRKDPNAATSSAPYRLYNIGSGTRVDLMDYVHTLEAVLGVKAKYAMMAMQPGDLESTNADTTRLENEFGFKPAIGIREGLEKFADWYRKYYDIA